MTDCSSPDTCFLICIRDQSLDGGLSDEMWGCEQMKAPPCEGSEKVLDVLDELGAGKAV